MKVEEVKRNMGSDFRGPRDQFPVGMRVLAVDDDPTCLKLLETLLLRCQYHVTTTGQAVTALKLLRENKDKFDLVISDVHMPDMDGFKLLELVGLEMDLPVIMLSGNSDTKAVMKGITHGACDYLLKPVRLEELKNIWQHVVRRRKFDSRVYSNSDNEDGDKCNASNEEGQGAATSMVSDRNGKLNKKRKDEDDNDGGDNGEENEDPSAQKKPRVVWSVELHQKFVAAIRQLGIEKAVPKRILDLMNVEGLTRENVASHLQKYRLYLKRLTTMTSQQANMVAALRARDPYMSAGSFNGYGSYHALAGSAQLPALTGFGSNNVLGRMNSPNGYGWQRLSSSGMIQFDNFPNPTRTSTNDVGKIQDVQPPAFEQGNLLQGVPTSLILDQLEQNNAVDKAKGPFHGGLTSCELLTNVANAPIHGGLASHHVTNLSHNPLLSHSAQQRTHHGGSNFIGDSTSIVDLARCKDTVEATAPLASLPSNSMSTTSNLVDNVSKAAPYTIKNYNNLPSGNIAIPTVQPSNGRCDFQNQTLNDASTTMIKTTTISDNLNFMNFSIGNDGKNWMEQNLDCSDGNIIYRKLNSSSGMGNEHILEHREVTNSLYNNILDAHVPTRVNHNAQYTTQQIAQFIGDGRLKDECATDTSKLQRGFNSNYCSLDDVVNGLIKPEYDDMTFMDGDIGCDIFPQGVDVS